MDTRPRGLRGRLLGGRSDNPGFVDWAAVEPFVGHVPSSRLLMPLRRLRRLHPAQIADLVEAASHDEGEEIISAVHGDPELEADVFEELNTEHQVEFLRDKSDAEAAAVLAEMGPDDAADLVTELDQPRRAPILSLLPPTQQAKVRALLSYGQSSAGGLMSPDFVSVTPDATVSDAIAAVCAADVVPQVAADVFLLDDGHLAGSVPLIELLRADGATRIADLVEHSNASVNADDDFPEVARRMADFNLTVVAVLDDDNRVVGSSLSTMCSRRCSPTRGGAARRPTETDLAPRRRSWVVHSGDINHVVWGVFSSTWTAATVPSPGNSRADPSRGSDDS